MFLFEVKRLIWSALEIEFFELYFLQPVLGGHPVTARFVCIIFYFMAGSASGKIKRMPSSDWLPEQAKRAYFTRLGFCVLFPERAFWFVRVGDHYADAIVNILAH